MGYSPTKPDARFDFTALRPFLLDAAGERLSDSAVTKVTGMTSFDCYRRRGWFTAEQADLLACRVAKVHPMLIWGEDWFAKCGASVFPPASRWA